MREGRPTERRDDLRYYLDQDGRFTDQLGQHYEPRRPESTEQHAVFVKTGTAWMEMPYHLLQPGMVVRVMERATSEFVVWQDTGTTEVAVMEVQQRGGRWAMRVRKPTAQEIADA